MITTDHQWMRAGPEPKLTEMLSDPSMRSLMQADGINADEVNAIIDRLRSSVQPLQFVPRRAERSGGAAVKTSKFVRALPLRGDDHKEAMAAASGVITRWIASLVDEKRVGLD
jgi:hypothetical protein